MGLYLFKDHPNAGQVELCKVQEEVHKPYLGLAQLPLFWEIKILNKV